MHAFFPKIALLFAFVYFQQLPCELNGLRTHYKYNELSGRMGLSLMICNIRRASTPMICNKRRVSTPIIYNGRRERVDTNLCSGKFETGFHSNHARMKMV